MQVAYADSLKASAAAALTSTLIALVALILNGFQRVSYYEWLKATDVGRVYFDVDGKKSETTEQALLDKALAGVRVFLELPADAPPPRLSICQSHGGNKLSFRIFLRDYKMVIGDQKRRLRRLGLDKNRPFDDAVYGRLQKLRTVGSFKTPQDRRVLEFLDGSAPTEQNILDTFVQHVTDDMQLLCENDLAPRADDALPTKQQATDPKVAPAPKRHRGRPSRDQSISPDNYRSLLDMGYLEPRFVSSTPEGFAFVANNRDRCPNCSHDHERQNWCAQPTIRCPFTKHTHLFLPFVSAPVHNCV